MRMEENITIEFVRNWIEKHHLTRKSYESVLTDTLTNNGHYYIDNPYLRDWIRKNTEMFRNILPYELNENQQVVLEWLEAYADKDSGDWPMQTIFYMWDCIRSDMLGGEELSALRKLTRIEQFEVLAAFAEWGKKEVAE
ncbi:hypothetical protein ABQE36_01070 [Enterococcus avium]|uniref:hypothetical protein n=2 Tax=Enterococcus avium TaxID=33945 RepID=UPI0032E3EF7C